MDRKYLGFAIILTSLTNILGQQESGAGSSRNRDIAEIERVEAEWNTINEISDAEGKRRLLADDSYHVGPSGRLYTKQQDIEAQIDGRNAKESTGSALRFVMSARKIRMFDGVAVVTATGRSVTTLADGNKRYGNSFRVVHVWEKRAGQWLLIVDQVTTVAR